MVNRTKFYLSATIVWYPMIFSKINFCHISSKIISLLLLLNSNFNYLKINTLQYTCVLNLNIKCNVFYSIKLRNKCQNVSASGFRSFETEADATKSL